MILYASYALYGLNSPDLIPVAKTWKIVIMLTKLSGLGRLSAKEFPTPNSDGPTTVSLLLNTNSWSEGLIFFIFSV